MLLYRPLWLLSTAVSTRLVALIIETDHFERARVRARLLGVGAGWTIRDRGEESAAAQQHLQDTVFGLVQSVFPFHQPIACCRAGGRWWESPMAVLMPAGPDDWKSLEESGW